MIVALILAASLTNAPSAEDIFARAAENRERCSSVSYSVTRTYTMRNLRFNKDARVVVRMTYRPHEGKKFTVVERSGSDILVSIVEKLIDAETEASLPSVAAKRAINGDNYGATLRGSATLAGRDCWIVELKPRTRDKFLFSGTAWIDKRAAAIVKLEGKTAASLSVWVGAPRIVENRAEVGGLWLPSHTISRSTTFLGGDSELEIAYTDYQIQH